VNRGWLAYDVGLVYAAVGLTEGTARPAEAERFPPGELVVGMPVTWNLCTLLSV